MVPFLCNPSPPPKYKTVILNKEPHLQSTSPQTSPPQPLAGTTPTSLCPYHAKLLSNDRVTAADHFQDVRLIKLDIAGSNIK